MRALLAGFAALALTAVSAHAQEPANRFDPARAIVADVQKIVTPNGLDETFELTLGGARQVVNVRGADRANPILIYVHGGPGSVEMPMAWTFQHPWEDYFTVVQWDQRGAGRSYPLNEPAALAPTLTLDRYRDDAIELIEALRQRYGKRKVIVLGHSFGSTIGLAVAQKRPDLLYAYVGMGQIIDFRENERVGLARTLAEARRRGDAKALAELEAIAPYPDAGPFTIAKADGWRKWANQYGSLVANRPDANFYFDATQLSPQYGAADLKAWSQGSSYTVTTLWPRLADVSFANLTRVDTPVILFLGRRDTTTPSSLAAAWLGKLRAPRKAAVWFENSGHLPMVEEPGRVFAALLKEVLPLAPREPAA